MCVFMVQLYPNEIHPCCQSTESIHLPSSHLLPRLHPLIIFLCSFPSPPFPPLAVVLFPFAIFTTHLHLYPVQTRMSPSLSSKHASCSAMHSSSHHFSFSPCPAHLPYYPFFCFRISPLYSFISSLSPSTIHPPTAAAARPPLC